MNNMMKMMGHFKEIQGKMEQVQETIAALEAEGTSGGGIVRVLLKGRNTLRKLKIDDSLLCKENAEILEDLIIAAHNDAQKKLEDLVAEKTREATAGLPIPDGFKLPL
ncbi:MAG: YbaB/EbfC family nucleoid-associated protein [Candidatus Liberibacter ctenarytainae]|uniref:Nucleoid-associated protein EU981_01130 n=1 Tax=Candidatus Liberibacter ctenarytainae TaxID=2020335 RepID=A0A937DGQ5_9HYPH|nr:YbaB/EbfC family nucleoid-associated protein [Candidatus Liberibacter ctenarytainae]